MTKGATKDEREELLAKVRAVPGETRESVRRAIRELEAAEEEVTVRAVKARAKGSGSGITYTVAAWRAELLDLDASWSRLDLAPPPKPKGKAPAGGAAEQSEPEPVDVESLLASIDAAATPSGIAEVAKKISRLIVAGQLDATAGRVALDACREQRMSLSDARKTEPPKEDGTKMFMCSAEAMKVAKAMDFLINGRRRALVMVVAALMLESDRADIPNLDSGGSGELEHVNPMKRLRLDAYGEPAADDPGARAISALAIPPAWERACRGELADVDAAGLPPASDRLGAELTGNYNPNF